MTTEFESLLGEDPAPQHAYGWSETVPTATLADMLGVSLRTVGELAQKGILTKASRGNWPLRESVRAYCAHLREQAAGRSGSSTLTAERIRAVKEQADKLAMANAVARGEMLPARQVQSEWASILRDVRAALLAVASRCGAALPHLTGHDVATIDGEIRTALEALADGN